MKKMLRNAALLTLCLAVLVSFGCNKKRIKGLVPAHGVVTLNGEPVAGAMVMFTPVKVGPEAFAASTTTDAQGAFKMTTLDPGDGVRRLGQGRSGKPGGGENSEEQGAHGGLLKFRRGVVTPKMGTACRGCKAASRAWLQ